MITKLVNWPIFLTGQDFQHNPNPGTAVIMCDPPFAYDEHVGCFHRMSEYLFFCNAFERCQSLGGELFRANSEDDFAKLVEFSQIRKS